MINNLVIAIYFGLAIYFGIQALRDGIPIHKKQLMYTVAYLVGILMGMLFWPISAMYVVHLRRKNQ